MLCPPKNLSSIFFAVYLLLKPPTLNLSTRRVPAWLRLRYWELCPTVLPVFLPPHSSVVDCGIKKLGGPWDSWPLSHPFTRFQKLKNLQLPLITHCGSVIWGAYVLLWSAITSVRSYILITRLFIVRIAARIVYGKFLGFVFLITCITFYPLRHNK